MKKSLLIALLIFINTSASFAQTRADYEQAMKKLMGFYNMNQGDSIGNMFADKQSLFDQGSVESLRKHNGKIRSFQYMGIDPGDSVVLIKTILVKLPEPHVIGMQLDKNNKIVALHMFTSSHYIDSLLAQFP